MQLCVNNPSAPLTDCLVLFPQKFWLQKMALPASADCLPKRWVSERSCVITPRRNERVGERMSMCLCVSKSCPSFCGYAPSLEKAPLGRFTSSVLVALRATFMPWICLPNKTNFLLCMGMRLPLPVLAYFYGNREKGKHKVGGGKSLKGRVRVGRVQKLRTDKTNGSVWRMWACYARADWGKMDALCWHAVVWCWK